ncbi:MAG: hypothetical protein K5694_02005 [Bacilli bacterium]|nr:hypothetical protein [Bacilli bacterium]
MSNEIFGYTYHSHTKRCGHAEGEDGEYAAKAYLSGYKILGYSDHVMLPDLRQPGMRGDIFDFEDYVKSVRNLQRKYRGKMKIHLGEEAEWYGDRYREFYASLLKDETLDYLICGQHCFLDGNRFIFYGSLGDHRLAIRKYADDLIDAMRSGLFLYVAHPDIYVSWNKKWDEFTKEIATELINEAKKLGTIFEINCGPSRYTPILPNGDLDNLAYPHSEFWKLVGEAKIPCILGVDSHRPYELVETPFDFFRAFIKRFNLNIIDPLKKPLL